MENSNVGFLKRFLANMIDMVIWFTVFVLPMFFLLQRYRDLELIDPVGAAANIVTFLLVFMFFGTVVFALYQIYFVSAFGGTIGKLACGIKIVDNDTGNNLDKKTAFYRIFAGYAFSGAFFGLGYWMIIKSKENRGWHDELFNTKVVKTSSALPGIITLIVLLGILAFLVWSSFSLLSATKLFSSL